MMPHVVARLRLLGLFEFVIFPVNPSADDECLEWYGDEREAEWVARAVRTVTARAGPATGQVVSGPAFVALAGSHED
jgi:hypothetical protein